MSERSSFPVPFSLVYVFEGVTAGSTSFLSVKNNRVGELQLTSLTASSWSDAAETRVSNWDIQISEGGSDQAWFDDPVNLGSLLGSGVAFGALTDSTVGFAFPFSFPPVPLVYGNQIEATITNKSIRTSNLVVVLHGHYGKKVVRPIGNTTPGVLAFDFDTVATGATGNVVRKNNRSYPFVAQSLIFGAKGTITNSNAELQVFLAGSGVNVFSSPVHQNALIGPGDVGVLGTGADAGVYGRRAHYFSGGGILIPPTIEVELTAKNLSSNDADFVGALRGYYVR